ncbi:MAG: DUF3291 domain-containing protein [Niveispirillum sp.]|uniref:DUF3291 domain-containing protein n=1 Tax=Niveispirillum sp. TaxID=1917217 RepID=UPI003BA4F7AD
MYQLAQINVARLLYPIDSPELSGFTSRLDAVNALAEVAPGFVWRLKGDGNDATSLRPFPDPEMIVNMSVWDSVDALFDFTYRLADHAAVMRGRRDWFARPTGAHMVLWWVPAGHLPTLTEARERLDHLDRHGPTPHAFTFKDRFAVPATHP